MNLDRLDRIVPADAAADVDLVAWCEEELARREGELQRIAGRVQSCRELLVECQRAAARLPVGAVLTVSAFVPFGLDDVSTATRRYLIQRAMEEET